MASRSRPIALAGQENSEEDDGYDEVRHACSAPAMITAAGSDDASRRASKVNLLSSSLRFPLSLPQELGHPQNQRTETPSSAQPSLLSPALHGASVLSASRGHFGVNPSPQQISSSVHERRAVSHRSAQSTPNSSHPNDRNAPLLQPAAANADVRESERRSSIPEGEGSSHSHGANSTPSSGAAAAAASDSASEKQKRRSKRSRHIKAVLFGLTAFVCCIPTQLAYGNITMSDGAFQNSVYLSRYLKLVFLSAAVTELIFVLRSNMVFAVGQVQDAGLIFLSQIATNLAEKIDGPGVHMDGVSAPAMATVVAAIGICTLLTGAFLIALGQLRLATLTNYIPLPVISGNLAFIGAFCFASSVKLMSNGIDMLSLRYPSDLSIWHALLLVGPGLLASVFMIVAQRVTDNAAVLPAIIILIPIIFYACLYGFNMSREDARAFGFLAADESITIKDSFELLNPQLVHWSALPSQVPNVLGLWLIVALGSTLDISACELALGTQKVNLNHEIEVIGWSNLLSGVCLGGTTSILFGQSTLAIKAGIEERSFGITVCVLEFIVCLLPGNITAYIPRPLFGAVLSFIGLDILVDWLYYSKSKITSVEYGVLISTFMCCLLLGFSSGVVAGILLSALTFLVSLVRSPGCSAIVRPSGVMRAYNERVALSTLRPRIMELQLPTHIFFGSSRAVERVVVPCLWFGPPTRITARGSYLSYHGLGVERNLQSCGADGSADGRRRSDEGKPFLRYLVLDCQWVSGIDASAARALAQLTHTVNFAGARVFFAGCKPQVKRLLEAHGALCKDEEELYSGDGPDPRASHFNTATEALQQAENYLLYDERKPDKEEALSSQYPVMGTLCSFLGPVEAGDIVDNMDQLEGACGGFFERQLLSKRSKLYTRGDWPDGMYLVMRGEVTLSFELTEEEEHVGGLWEVDASRRRERIVRVKNGFVGANDALLRCPRTHGAEVTSPYATVFKLSATKHQDMQRKAPEFAAKFTECLSKALALEASMLHWY